jgi:microcin C transport system substrate-binding protein
MYSYRFVKSFLILVILCVVGCSSAPDPEQVDETARENSLEEYASVPMSENLVWLTNNEDPVFSSPDAKTGGTYYTSMFGFPLTLRRYGPDANGHFGNFIHAFNMGLTNIHPNTNRPIPELASHWAFAEDGKTVYFKLDPDAIWSDGVPVTADDYIFTRDFMRSEFIIDPYYNNYFTSEIIDVNKHSSDVISVSFSTARPRDELLYYTNIKPVARHFHNLDKSWVQDNNWKVEPNTGAYYISKVNKGKSVEFSRNKQWWARDKRYFRNRYNVDKMHISVIREVQTSFNHFLKGEIDAFWMPWPDYWHDKATGEPYDKGFIHKLHFYNQMPQSIQGLLLNLDFALFEDINVRKGLAHAINVKKVIDVLIRGDYDREHTVYSGYPGFTNSDIRARNYDLEQAEHYFNLAGWSERGADGIRIKDQQRMSINIPYAQTNLTERFVLFVEEAKKAGVEIVLQQMDRSAMFKNYLEKKHQMAFLAMTTGFRPNYWEFFHSDNAHKANTNNFNNVDDPELDAMIDSYRVATDDETRQSLSREIQQRIHELAIYIPLWRAPFTRYSYWRWMQLPEHYGTRTSDYLFPPTGGGLFWVDEEIKKETQEAMKSGRTFDPVTIVDDTWKM